MYIDIFIHVYKLALHNKNKYIYHSCLSFAKEVLVEICFSVKGASQLDNSFSPPP